MKNVIRHNGCMTVKWIAWTVLAWVTSTGCVVAAEAAEAVEPEQPAAAYIAAFRHHLDLAVRDLEHLAHLADGAAEKFIENRFLNIARNAHYFYSELSGRASGLTGINGWDAEEDSAEKQLLLFSLDSAPTDRGAQEKWLNTAAQAQDSQIVLMANRRDLATMNCDAGQRPFQPSDFYGFVDNHVPNGEFTFQVAGPDGTATRRAMLSPVVNALNGWLFVGEIAAACTRRGEMPIFWLAFQVDMPRGLPRNALYSVTGKAWGDQNRFHEDFKVPPVTAGIVGAKYIAHLRSYLDRLERWPDLKTTVGRIVATIKSGKKVYFYSVGHMFPHVVPTSQRQRTMRVMDAHYFKLEESVLNICEPGDLLFLLCMPAFEDKTVTSALGKGIQVVAMSTAQPPEAIQDKESFHWIAAPWPITDGCVEIPGYDIPVLAVTGVMHSVIYYAVRSQVEFEMGLAAAEPVAAGE